MKLAVCFKALADFDRLSASDWVWNENHEVDTGFVRRIYNCYEESALEQALKLGTSRSVENAELTALTIDGQVADLFLRHLMAVGYDHTVRIQCGPGIDLRFNPSAVSRLIAAYLQSAGHQLVILGRQGGEGDNRQTGPLVAERLGWPCIGEVADVDRTESPDHLRVTSRWDGATRVQVVKLPLVLVMGQSLAAPYLRIPTLKQKLAAKKRRINVLAAEELGVDDDLLTSNDKTLLGLINPQPQRACQFIEGTSARQLARRLYEKHLKERLGR